MVHLNGEEIFEKFYEKELHTIKQNRFRIKKLLLR